MQISSDDILTSGLLAAGIEAKKILQKTNEPFADDNGIFNIQKALSTKYALNILSVMVLGAIEEYHDQLKEKLLESNIDIGDLDTKSTKFCDALVKYYGSDEPD